ncbi:helix-turn-helix transcriptional regulator [Crenobacter luteus]|uniref:AlpA family transcriptional regulator n=1 Tax=Crenobacter luteus TaxID=1452487 RepID=A0A163B9T1_9NEIS|nr:AlpA family transcriptional regulator [Crenobacter luteus]KZE25330.1 hypothetical protein AVW16_03245 [Crenobacter luteus]
MQNQTPGLHMLRLPEVMKLTGLSRSTLYALVQRGQFPRQIQLGARSVAWLSSDIEAWIAARIAQSKQG